MSGPSIESALADESIPAPAKLSLLILDRLASEAPDDVGDPCYVSAQDVATASGRSVSTVSPHLRFWSREFPKLVERKAWLDENERKIVGYRAQLK